MAGRSIGKAWQREKGKSLKTRRVESLVVVYALCVSMLLGILMPYSLRPGPRTSSKHLLFRDNLSIHYVDVLHSVDFPILVELNGGFDIDVL
jgi:hypothetical protein